VGPPRGGGRIVFSIFFGVDVDTVNAVLFFLSSAMLLPVIILLLLLFLRSLLLLGGFFGLAAARMKVRARVNLLVRKEDGSGFEPESLRPLASGRSLFSAYLGRMLAFKGEPGMRGHLLTEYELEAAALAEKSKILMRVGPMLGLMGTLIPMGPALAGLASGDLGMMAQNMQIAFATTVIGVFCGIVGFVLNTIHRRWFAEELADLAWIEEALPHEA
jgi:biopolymer transport protein ExbB/TolQ